MADVATADSKTREPTEPPPVDDSGKPKAQLLDSARLAAKWSAELNASKKWMQKFTERAKRCEKAYIDEGDLGTTRSGNQSRVNIFWSNVQVTLAAIYGRLPKATVDRKFRDYDDDVARVAAEMLERILNSDIQRDCDDTNSAMRDAVQDRFVCGMGQVWCRYDVQTEEYEQPQTDPLTGQPATDEAGQPLTQKLERILNEDAATDYVYWEDFRYSPCRRWRECRWVARRVWMAESRLAARFKLSDAQVAMVPMNAKQMGNATDDVLKATPFKQAAIWEIWDRDSNRVVWFAEGCSFVLDVADDILQLEDFFPCPQPVVATTLTRSFLPKPDYVMAQDLYDELDTLNHRLAKLEQAVKAVGTRDKNAKGLEKMMDEATENQLVPVENWSAFIEKGGLRGSTDWMPIDQFVNAITQLTDRKMQVQRDLYELLGISDIMRGASNASETATAQQLKATYGGARLSSLQSDVSHFVAGVMRIRANIVCNHFQPETIKRRSLVMKTPDAPLADQACAMLKADGLAMHNVSVSADTLAAPDWELEKRVRTEFMGAVSNYVMAAGPLIQQNPSAGIFLMKMLQWGTAGFKGAESIEGVIDQAVRQFEQAAQNPPPPAPPSPDDQKALAGAKKASADADKASAEAQGQKQENALMAAAFPAAGGMGAPMAPGAPGGAPMAPQGPPQGLPGQPAPPMQ